ncbi:TetR/AcrR family transcriptional regulator [Goodfellowiella coeruleoviolacea]|uniref:TetR/AcrR family transcriptional regulator n=1 Tax=Goodfellowiella coeruleoviolacea TaxID=334858 RepID=UPI0020A4A5AD|nr:TetR family transcriptional regulator [Goodfellowiella coeruleoviolacea]
MTSAPRRKRDAAATRSALLAAATLRFAQDGYDHTSVRDIAADVGVNQALVYRYFGSKDALFEEVAAHSAGIASFLSAPLDAVADRMLRHLFQNERRPDGSALLAMLQSASHDETRQRLRELIRQDFTDTFATRLAGPEPELRAELLAAWLIGIGFLRSVVGTPALCSATAEQADRCVRRVTAALLYDHD